MIRLKLLVGFVLALLVCAASVAVADSTVHFDRSSFYPIVKVNVGSRTYRMLLDTGSSYTIITNTMYADIGSPNLEDASQFVFDRAQRSFFAGGITDLSLRIESASFHGKSLVFSKAASIQCYSFGIDGLIGLDWLQKRAVKVDWDRRELTFYSHGALSKVELLNAGLEGAARLGNSRPDRRKFCIRAQIGKTQGLDFMIDTGSPYSSVTSEVAEIAGLVKCKEDIASGADGISASIIYFPTNYEVGPFVQRNVSMMCSGKNSVFLNVNMIGHDVLATYEILIDFPANILYLKPRVPEAFQPLPVQPAETVKWTQVSWPAETADVTRTIVSTTTGSNLKTRVTKAEVKFRQVRTRTIDRTTVAWNRLTPSPAGGDELKAEFFAPSTYTQVFTSAGVLKSDSRYLTKQRTPLVSAMVACANVVPPDLIRIGDTWSSQIACDAFNNCPQPITYSWVGDEIVNNRRCHVVRYITHLNFFGIEDMHRNATGYYYIDVKATK